MRTLAIALSAVLACQAAPLAADNYAQTAADLANAIRDGDVERQRELLPPLTGPEYAEVARLSGCDGYMGSAGRDRFLVIDWHCDEQGEQPAFRRSTVMLFDNHGELFGFAINGIAGDLAATQVAQDSADIPSPRAILRDFAEAVTNGEDPSLGGLINLEDFDRARLALYRSGNFRVSNRRRDGSFFVRFWEGRTKSGPSRTAMIQFDDDGRPVGLLFAPRYIRTARARFQDDSQFSTRLNNARGSIQATCVIC